MFPVSAAFFCLEILKKAGTGRLVEMDRTKRIGFCCGATMRHDGIMEIDRKIPVKGIAEIIGEVTG